MNLELEIWYPNYKNNPGIVSKELKSQVSELLQHFEATVIKGEYADYERFLLNLKLENPEYKEYLTTNIYTKLGRFTDPSNLKIGDTVLGRTFSPGKVGFGIFIDIGIRKDNEQNDALLPLYQIRSDLELEDLSTREIVKMLGLVDGYPIPVIITSIQLEPKLKIDVKLSDDFIEKILDWSDDGKERLIVTKVLKSSVEKQIKNLQLNKYIERIESIDPLTTVVVCEDRTKASGILPKIGARLSKAPIGIFHP